MELIGKDLKINFTNIKCLNHKHELIKTKMFLFDFQKCFCCLKNITTLNYINYFKCTKCDYIICNKCKITKERGEKWQFLTCWHEHPLTFCRTKGRTGYNNIIWIKWNEMEKIKEENIEKIIKLKKEKEIEKKSSDKKENFVYGSYRKSSSYTQTQLITEEKIEDIEEKKKKKLFINLKDKKKLNFNRYVLEYEYFFTCNHCGIKYSRKQYMFYCTACDFCICIKCYKDYCFYNGRDRDNEIIPSIGNDEIYPAECKCLLGDIQLYYYCKICEIELDAKNFNYYCSNCNSNFCKQCYIYHKVIFKDNILIFDGYFSKTGEKYGFGITYKKNNEKNYEGYWTNNKFELIDTIPHPHKDVYRDDYKKIEYICDICLKKCDTYDTGMFCPKCNLNICDLCVIEINKKTLKRKDHEHNLNIAKFNEKKYCSVCNKYKKGILFICPYCNREKGFLEKIFSENDYYCCLECFNVKTYKIYK